MQKNNSLQKIMVAILATFFLFSSLGLAHAARNGEDILNQSAKAFASLVKQAKPAVVHVEVEKTVGARNYNDQLFQNPFFEHFFGPEFRRQIPQQRKQKQKGQGSGFIISADGYILTNNHVVEDADSITVTLADKSKIEAKLIGSDPQSDVALIKIDNGNKNPFLSLGDSDALEVGEWVIAIGNPFGLTQTVTVGVVSAKGRSSVGLNEYENFIQTDAAINPGNSGGPLLNIQGKVIGINSALFSRTGGYMGIGFAIPINMVKKIEKQLQNNGKVTRGWLGVGIQNIDDDLAKSFDLDSTNGILITEVQPDSPAEKAGIKQGDVIVSLDGRKLEHVQELRNKIALIVPGTEASIGIIRNGKAEKIDVKIGEKPGSTIDISGSSQNSDFNERFGLSFQELTPEIAKQLGYEGEEGVLIGDVERGSVAEAADLKAGQLIQEINRKPVRSAKDLRDILKNSAQDNRILLRIKSGKYSRYVVLVAP